VTAWWDYGYQITGIANRTSIADGNTWNHEHIANLARSLTATEEKGHRVIRHLADYVLVWSGGGADDMAKSPHLFRIGRVRYIPLSTSSNTHITPLPATSSITHIIPVLATSSTI
jgi:asparagine N-glycosylation enzyme membrane subunit Stt3